MTWDAAAPSPLEPKARQCPHCDFGSGQRGMDRCGRCDGTGSVFWVLGQRFPNTKRGYEMARAILWGCS